MYEPKLNIGLTYYQETQWISAIIKYGTSIMNKSLLTIAQKDTLVAAAQNEQKILGK